MRDFVIRWQAVTILLLMAACFSVSRASGAESEAFLHLLTLPLDHVPQAKPSLNYETQPLDVAFSNDGKILAAAFNERGVLLFDLPSGQVKATIRQPEEKAHCVTFSPNGKLLAHSGSGAWLWDVTNSRPKPWGDHPRWASALAFSPDGKRLAIGTYREPYHSWDLETGKSVAEFDMYAGTDPHLDRGLYKPHVAAFAFAPDGKTLATHIHFSEDELPTFDHIQIWDLESHALRTSFHGTHGLFTPDGETFVYGLYEQIKFRNAKNMVELATLERETTIVSDPLWVMALSRDGKTLAASTKDNAVRLWNLPDRKSIATLKGHEQRITSVAISTDGTRVASSSIDGSIRVWAARSP